MKLIDIDSKPKH